MHMRDMGRRGFTLIEVLVVLVVLAILATIGTVTYTHMQERARDSERASKAQLIADALEDYYDKNGEYPGCEALTASGETVTSNTLKTLSPATLLTPQAADSATNSILCNDIDSIPDTTDAFAYSGDSSATCRTGPACAKWQLQVRTEAGDTVVIKSRHSAEAIASVPDLSVSSAGLSAIDAAWTSVQDAISYELQRSLTPGFASVTTTTHTTIETQATGLNPDTDYYFRVRAILPSSASAWSDVVSASTGNVTKPTGTITVSATISGSSARGTGGGGSCQSGAVIERQVRYQVNGGSWFAYNSSNPRDVNAIEGYTYTFQSRARCKVGSAASGYVESSTASTTRSVSAPSGLVISAAMSGTNARGTASGGSCPSGTSIERQIRYAESATSATGTYSSYTTGTARSVAAKQGWRYTFQQQARCVGTNAASPWASSSTASTVRSITAPAKPTVSVSTSGNTTTFTSSVPSCPTGATAQYRLISEADWGYSSGWTGAITARAESWNTSSQGYQYKKTYQVRCHTSHTDSSWSASGVGSYVRAVSAPTGISWTFSKISGPAVKISPSANCGPAAIIYGNLDPWSGDIAWASGPNKGSKGWYSSTGYLVNNAYNPYTGANQGTIKFASGHRWRAKGSLRCRNSVTNRQSSAVTSTSNIWTY